MICLIAENEKAAARWARGQNLRIDEWFYAPNVFAIYGRKNFHTIVVPEGIENIHNDNLNRLLTAAWSCGQKR